MKSLRAVRTLVLAAGAALALAACVVAPYPAGPVYPTTEPVIMAPMAPPAPYAEVVPVAPYAGAVWISGYWNWSGGRHEWVPGRYARPAPGYHWQPRSWTPAPRGGWQLRGGGWAR